MPEAPENKAKASFLSKISHELKSPIHGIVSLSDYLEHNWELVDDKTKRKCVSEIARSGGSLNILVDSLFNYSAFNEGQIRFDFKKLNFIPLIQEVITNMGIFIVYKPYLSIKLNTSIAEGKIMADPIWFKQLLSNIIINSIKFSEKGVISIDIVEEKKASGKFYKCSISDEGIGIPEDELTEIFNEFNSGSRQFSNVPSTGLGLAICEEIVSAHGGQIGATNNVDKGTTVEFFIPKAKT